MTGSMAARRRISRRMAFGVGVGTLHLDFPSRMYLPRFGGAFLLAKRYPNPRRPELPCFDEGTHSGDRGPPHDGTLSKK